MYSYSFKQEPWFWMYTYNVGNSTMEFYAIMILWYTSLFNWFRSLFWNWINLIFSTVKITKITNFIAIKKPQLTNRILNYTCKSALLFNLKKEMFSSISSEHTIHREQETLVYLVSFKFSWIIIFRFYLQK